MGTGRLEGRTVVVVGGTAGLGLSAVRKCLAEGARVVAIGWNLEQVSQEPVRWSDSLRWVEGDARDPQTAVRAVELAVATFGQLDGLYHVAGGSGRSAGDGPLAEVPDAGWKATLEWNLDSVFYSNRAALRQLLRQGRGGAILNLASVLAFAPAPLHFGTHAYAAAKAAVIGLSRAAAATYAARNIRINVVAPALVNTPMAQRAVGDERIGRYIRSRQPLQGGRIGKPEDLDDAVVYFLSDASRYVTGQVLAVDGGWSVADAYEGEGNSSESEEHDPGG